MPVLGNRYTREEIAREHGGGAINYLPNDGSQVFCACLRLDYNPRAPEIILPGPAGQTVEAAELLCQMETPIPVYIRRAANEWEFVGYYEVDHEQTAEAQGPNVVDQFSRDGDGLPAIHSVVFMQPVEQEED